MTAWTRRPSGEREASLFAAPRAVFSECRLHLKRGEPTYRQRYLIHPCGTPACALGHWAAAHPERGWRFKEQDTRAELTGVGLYQGDTWAMDAAETEFGLTLEEAWALFGPHGCGGAKSARGAAAYIREFVRRRAR